MIENLRKILVEELEKSCSLKPIDLLFDESFLKSILFEDDHFSTILRGILGKIDFSKINFDGIKVCGEDMSMLYGVKINPQTVWSNDLGNTVCKGVEFIGSFDGVCISNTNLEGSNYNEITNFGNIFREKVRMLVKGIN